MTQGADDPIYDPTYVARLFDEMAKTYGVVNLISSFGFAAIWRKQALSRLPNIRGTSVVDLMTGMGELGPDIGRRVGPTGQWVGVDISPVMCERARHAIARSRCRAEIIEGDALDNALASESADAIVSTFGLKTFSRPQLRKLAAEIARILKPGGVFTALEISIPPSRLLRWPYLFYINRVIPLVGRLMLGNPDNYRMLGIYTEKFGNCRHFADEVRAVGMIARSESYFFGCATGVSGCRPS